MATRVITQEELDLYELQACNASCTDNPVCLEQCLPRAFDYASLLVTVVLVMLSGMFSGLTLGLLSLSLEGLDIIVAGGEPDEKRWAKKIYPIRKSGNLLLCTLLLGNTLVNALIAILSASMTSGLVGGLISTGVIVVFGEIIPQSICSRHGLRIGASAVCIVRPLMILLLPITWPIAKVLDWALGREMGTAYNRKQLDALLQIHMNEEALDTDDQKMLCAALKFSEKSTGMIMTELKDVFMISVTDKLDFDNLKAIYQSGYTRIPVFQNRRDTIVGVVFTKDLILVDPNDEIPVASILPFCSRALNAAPTDTHLDSMLKEMQSSRSHLYFVTDTAAGIKGVSKKVPRVADVVGIVTMEDLIEELIAKEIVDDFDVVQDNKSKKAVAEGRRSARLEFFEMLQRREIMQHDGSSKAPPPSSTHAHSAKTTEEVRALTSFLSSNVPIFKPAAISSVLLRKLVLRCVPRPRRAPPGAHVAGTRPLRNARAAPVPCEWPPGDGPASRRASAGAPSSTSTRRTSWRESTSTSAACTRRSPACCCTAGCRSARATRASRRRSARGPPSR